MSKRRQELLSVDVVQNIQYNYLCGATVQQLAKWYDLNEEAILSTVNSTEWTDERAKLRSLAYEQLQDKVLNSTAHAIEALDNICRDEDVSPKVRVEASNAILNVSPLKVTRVEANINQKQALVQKVYVSMQEQSQVDQHIDSVINGEISG